jgi:ABC-type transporter Mla MlaB component
LAVPEPRTIVLVIGGPIGRSDVLGLAERARALLDEGGTDLLVCDVRGLQRPDLVAIEALARLQLTARRRGARVLLAHASPALLDFLAYAGLDAVLPRRRTLRLEALRQPEEWEQALGVQEEGESDDPTA